MITEQKLSVAETARRLDVGENLLREWRKAFLAKGDDAFPGHGNPAPADDELRRLRAENARLRAERDLLKRPPRTSPTRPPDVPAHRRQRRPVARRVDVAALELSESGYDVWAARVESATEHWRRELVGAIEQIHAEVKGRYGSPRMTAELNARGHACSENTVAERMWEHGIRARGPKRFVRTTDSNHRLPVAANVLDREFDPDGPNERWCADITYIPTREGWLYLAVVEDLFSRMIVGWSMSASMESRLVVDALSMAIRRRRPEAGLLAHSDRGSQYAGGHYQRVLRAEGIVCSMSAVGQCWENAPMESFFGRLKCEVEEAQMFVTRDQARAAIFEYLEVFYNRVRRHSSLGFLSPVEYERAHNQTHR